MLHRTSQTDVITDHLFMNVIYRISIENSLSYTFILVHIFSIPNMECKKRQ